MQLTSNSDGAGMKYFTAQTSSQLASHHLDCPLPHDSLSLASYKRDEGYKIHNQCSLTWLSLAKPHTAQFQCCLILVLPSAWKDVLKDFRLFANLFSMKICGIKLHVIHAYIWRADFTLESFLNVTIPAAFDSEVLRTRNNSVQRNTAWNG